jgi:hyaluronan synthase
MFLFNILLRIFLALALIVPIIVMYNYTTYGLSVYGIYLFLYLCIQGTFSIINEHYEWSKWLLVKKKRNINVDINNIGLYNILVVGYREDPKYYTRCLESLKNIISIHLNKIYIIIDGNDQEDEYMIEIFKKVFTNTRYKTTCIRLDQCENSDDMLIKRYFQQILDNNIICIAQKHGGKRRSMSTGFQFSLLENSIYNKNIEAIFCTDSDTIIEETCTDEMFSYFSDQNIGAICGNLSIYNKYDSVITFLTSIRYWYAFNLERAYQSLTGSVLCVSGPIGMYKLRDIQQILKDWREQTFLGKLCNYGDDRHLTNKILSLGKKVIYTHLACASTETPNNFYRFFKQQIRWNKSAFREIFWNIPILHKQSLFMTVDLIYIILYPFFCVTYLMYVLWRGTILDLGIYFTIICVLGIIKSIYGYIRTRNLETVLYFLYSLIYISVVFPAKIVAVLNINDNSWGTSSRKIISDKVTFDITILLFWNSLLVSGLFFNIYNSILKGIHNLHYLYTLVISLLFILGLSYLYIYVYIKQRILSANKLQ